jgi:hypothetical protein
MKEVYQKFLVSLGADHVFHKDGTFLDHLLEVHHILTAWKVPPEIAALGAFHSIYRTSWISSSICVERKHLQTLIGDAESLVWEFAHLDRMPFTFDFLPKMAELAKEEHLPEILVFQGRSFSRREIAIFTILTMADFAQQFCHWQDDLFQVESYKNLAGFFQDLLERKSDRKENPRAVWPQTFQPGLYLHFLSSLNQLLIKLQQPDLVCPVLLHPLSFEDEKQARDLYCECRVRPSRSKMLQAIQCNPHIPELFNVLAQIELQEEDFDSALSHALNARDLFEKWGTCWDKSVSFQSWVIHTNLLISQAKKKNWPKTSMEIIDLSVIS